MTTVRIDHERCQGHSVCTWKAAELFASDDEGYAQVLVTGRLSESQESDAREAQGNCPEGAIIIEAEERV